jgi:REP element-mobilizing transposase RayT
MDSLLDRARSGPLYLRRPEVAELMVSALLYGQDCMKYYELHAWVVMANHVHLLLTPFVEMTKITHSLKRFTAREANRILGLTGPFWQEESYDRLVRNAGEFDRIVRYIECNPVKAGLVLAPADFPWSSAARS